MSFPVIKGAAYALFHAPDILLIGGSTQRVERLKNPETEYLQKVPSHLRSYEEVVQYAPNQVFIGNLWPEELDNLSQPWYANPLPEASAQGKFGDIVSEDILYGLLKLADSFDLVCLEKHFQEEVKQKLSQTGLFEERDLDAWKAGSELEEIQKYIQEAEAEELRLSGRLVGCVRRAHDVDENLKAHVILENLCTKATAIWAVRRLLKLLGSAGEEVEYLIETSEEACGDMNQRGGGNFAKAIGEKCGLINATGADMRSFCAGPVHGIVAAAALVQAGIYKNVIVLGGGAVAKLGMNGRDHIKRGLPLLEDVLGAFAVMVGENDGINPVIRTDVLGRHKIGSGSTPQAVMEALVTDPLAKANLKITEIDKYAGEMQNPEITEPAGAGNVPKANYKMIGALAVMKGEVQRGELEDFIRRHGIPGYAPTQGHVPSGVPFLGFAREGILSGKFNRVMIIGKGSLFLGRMTGLFDGVSFVVEKNRGETPHKESKDMNEVRALLGEALRKVAREMMAQVG